MRKKITAIFLSFLFLIVLPLSAGAEGFEYTFQNGSPYCSSLLMLNMDTDTVVYSMNPDERVAVASLTKIMSYIVTVETITDLNNTRITVPQSVADALADTGSSLAEIAVGEEFSAFELLNMMIIPSGNDAAATLAAYIDGLNITVGSLQDSAEASAASESDEDSGESTDDSSQVTEEDPSQVLTFVDLMNRKAQELGCVNTHFVNAHGLNDENHYSTARDMMTISQYALKLPYFTEIITTTYYERPATSITPNPEPLYNTNKMILKSETDYYYEYCTGIKTGSLDESGFCIVSTATHDYTYMVVALGSPYRDADGNKSSIHGEMLDAVELFRWAFSELQVKTIAENGELMGDVSLNYTWNQDKLQVVAGENVRAVLPANVESTSIIPILELPDSIDAPVKKGDVVGTATLTYADQVVGTVTLVAAESVERSEMMKTLEQGKAIFTSIWFQIALLLVGALLIIYVILMVLYRKRKRRKRRRYHKRNM